MAHSSTAKRCTPFGDTTCTSDWSDGGSSTNGAHTGIRLGLMARAHRPRPAAARLIANGLSAERLTQQIGIVDAIDRSLGGAFRLLKGIEVDILDDGGWTRPTRCSPSSTSSRHPCTASCG